MGEITRRAHVHIPVTFAHGSPRFGVLGGRPLMLVGWEDRPLSEKEAESKLATIWDATLLPGRADVHAFWLVSLELPHRDPISITSTNVTRPPPSDLEWRCVDAASGFGDQPSGSLLWATLDAIEEGDVRRACAELQESMRQFWEPTTPLRSVDIRTGALDLSPITQPGMRVSTHATRLPWEQALARGEAVVIRVRAQLTAAIASGTYPPDICAELQGWLDVCKPPRVSDVTPELRESCYALNDSRLATIPYASHARSIETLAMAPLPGPPDQSRVPSYAVDWRHAVKGTYYRASQKYHTQMHSWLLYVYKHGTTDGAPYVGQVAFGIEGYEPWAAELIAEGHTIVREGGRLQLLDQSQPPATHWHRPYLAEVLAHSRDEGLKCAILTHGVSFLADLEPQTVLLRHLPGLAGDGFSSVNKELLRLTGKQWYGMQFAYGEPGDINFGTLPGRCISIMAVPRGKEMTRWRRVSDNRQPRRALFTIGKIRKRVISLADACGWDESKRIRREAMGPAKTYLRHTPAVRRPAPPVTQVPPASSKTPTQIAAMLASGQLTAAQGAYQLSLPRHGPELKPIFADVLLTLCLMGYMAFLADVELVGFGDDESDCFHQFMLELRQRWACGIMMLEPTQVLAGLLTADLVRYIEYCMNMGTPPSSGYAQRLNSELGADYERRCNLALLPQLRELAATRPLLREYIDTRLALERKTGRRELKTVSCDFYSDDPLSMTLEPFVTTALVVWTKHTGPRGANITMGTHVKRELGVSLGWIGGEMFLTGALGFITGAKQVRTLDEVRALLQLRATVEEASKLIGLLNHVVCILIMPYHIMYGMYAILDLARAQELPGTAIAPVPEDARRSLLQWESVIGSHAGGSALAAAFHAERPASSTAVARIFQDAAVEGTHYPGICGNFYKYYYVVALNDRWRQLPIVALEFAGPIISLMTFAHLLPTAPLSLVMDALVVPIILASKAGTPLMQFFHRKFLELPIVSKLKTLLGGEHTFGARNVVADAGSRGREAELRELLYHFGLEATKLYPPQAAFEMLDEAYELWRVLTAGEQALGDGESSNSLKDGPSRGVWTSTNSAAAPAPPLAPALPGVWGAPVAVERVPFPMAPWATGERVAPPSVTALPLGKWSAPARAMPSTVRMAAHPYACAEPRNAAGLRGVLAPALSARAVGVAASFATALQDVDSQYALRPRADGLLSELLPQLAGLLERSYADSTNSVDNSHWRAWEGITAELGTQAVRNDAAANSGADPAGFLNEALLQCLALLMKWMRMSPRSHADPAADPNSAMAMVRGARRTHQRMGITMAPLTMASRVLKGLCRAYVEQHGVRDVRRKLPLDNGLINGMLMTPEDAEYGGLRWSWVSYRGVATRACFETQFECGMRKDEVSKLTATTARGAGHLSFASLVWKIDSQEVTDPTPALLNSLSEVRGDGVWLRHGVAKNDFFGTFFAATPSFLPYRASGTRCAARALRALELLAQVNGAARKRTPLFGASPGREFTHKELEDAFYLLLHRGAGVAVARLSDYSIHSIRIFVACALLAANVPRPTIKRLLRWRGDESLEIYARLNDDEWTHHVRATYVAHVDSAVAGRLGAIGPFDFENLAPAIAQGVAVA